MTLKTELLEHQQNAVEKLSVLKVGALYMEQGTGKTRTTLGLIEPRLLAGKIEKVLWLCPCSVKLNLEKDIVKHTGSKQSDIIKICGIETLSSSINANLELLEYVEKYKTFLVVDESNLVKNFKAKRTQNIIRLAEKCSYKLILNGTPISKFEADLFAQWYILDKRILGYNSFYSFAANHIEYDETTGMIRRCLNVDYLTRKIAPYTYQVKKSECLNLPDKNYGTAYYSMSRKQYEEYDLVADMLMLQVDEMRPETIYRLFTGLQDVISGLYVREEGNSIKTSPMYANPRNNPRINAMLDVLEDIEDEKVIIFAKYTHEIKDILKVLTEEYGVGSAVPFYGELNQKQRQDSIVKFSENARFLVANKTCAGYGLNLQFCSNVIYYSNDWNYATRAQSEDRVHRIGQDKNVRIVDLCANDTLDEKILQCLEKKENLADSFRRGLKEKKDLTLDELLEIEKVKKEKRNLTNTEIVWKELSDKQKGEIEYAESLQRCECV